MIHRLRILVSTLLVLPVLAGCSRPEPRWSAFVSGGGPGEDTAQAAAMDADGNLYVGGSFSGTADFGGRSVTSKGKTDLYLAKYSGTSLQWILSGGGVEEDIITDLALDARGNIYVTGWTGASSAIPTGPGELKAIGRDGANTLFVAKYAPAGTLTWLRTGDAPIGMNRGHAVAVDPDSGNVFVTGMAQGPLRFSSGTDGFGTTVEGPFTWHMVVVKYDTNGNFVWGSYNQSAPNSIGRDVAIDGEQNVYVTGWLEGQSAFVGPDRFALTVPGISSPVQIPPYLGDVFLAKFDPHGRPQWVNQIGGYKANGISVAASRRGEVAVTGVIGNVNERDESHGQTIMRSSTGEQRSLGSGVPTNPYNPDAVVATYSADGKILSAARIGGAGRENGTCVLYDGDGSLYVAGAFEANIAAGARSASGRGASNLFILKYPPRDPGRPPADEISPEWIQTLDNAAYTAQPEAGYPNLSLSPRGELLVATTLSAPADTGPLLPANGGAGDALVATLSVR